ncbi:MAG: helix-turn-helix domain-containing protein [Lapillicoccus sp.]
MGRPPISRMHADDRRTLVLEAAMRAFARSGYAGTSTDAVAREAGVSQPYVVRIFGTKLELFLAVFDRAMAAIGQAFVEELARAPFDPDNEQDWGRLGATYSGLLVDRDLLLVMMHGMVASGVPEIGVLSRDAMARIFRVLTGTGCTPEQARDFIAQGMLLNVLMAMRAPEHLVDEPELAPLTVCAFGTALPAMTA